jgi:hypothetical protein
MALSIDLNSLEKNIEHLRRTVGRTGRFVKKTNGENH